MFPQVWLRRASFSLPLGVGLGGGGENINYIAYVYIYIYMLGPPPFTSQRGLFIASAAGNWQGAVRGLSGQLKWSSGFSPLTCAARIVNYGSALVAGRTYVGPGSLSFRRRRWFSFVLRWF